MKVRNLFNTFACSAQKLHCRGIVLMKAWKKCLGCSIELCSFDTPKHGHSRYYLTYTIPHVNFVWLSKNSYPVGIYWYPKLKIQPRVTFRNISTDKHVLQNAVQCNNHFDIFWLTYTYILDFSRHIGLSQDECPYSQRLQVWPM